MRRIAPLILMLALATTGCAVQGVNPSTSPSALVSQQSASEAPVAQPLVTPPVAEFTPELLASLCVEQAKTRGDDEADEVIRLDEARIERRVVDPPWLVIVPVTRPEGGDPHGLNLGTEWLMMCTIGGTPEEPYFESWGGQLGPVTEEEVQVYIHGMPGED